MNIVKCGDEEMMKQLTLMRNECLFNSFVMYIGIRRIKKKNKVSDQISYLINIGVVITTLMSIFYTAFVKPVNYDVNLLILKFHMSNAQASLFFALLAFGLSIAIFLFRNKKETKVHYNIANSYWLLHKRAQDLIDLQKTSQCSSLYSDLNLYLCHEVEKIKQQMELLVRFSPVFESEDIDEAEKSFIDSSAFLYFDADDITEIKKFFRRKSE